MRVSLISQPFWGTPIYGNPHVGATRPARSCALQVEVAHVPEMLSPNDHIFIFGVGG